MTWATIEDVRARWADAPLDDVLLAAMLDAAHETVAAYAPTLPPEANVPASYREAEVLQLRALWSAQERDGDVLGFGESGYVVRVRPLDTTVRALLRPRRGRPGIR